MPAAELSHAPGRRTLRSVHVAGSFNGWPKTIADGGFPLTYAADRKQWSLSQKLPVGTHTYKLVLDESGVADRSGKPQHPARRLRRPELGPDCLCEAGTPADPTANLPADSRPEDFPFDDHAQARIVTSVHAEEYRKTARLLAERAAANLPALVPLRSQRHKRGGVRRAVHPKLRPARRKTPAHPQEVQR